ncbi:membrane protein [Nocardioides flavus (ex Wang et al. 2016)]|uniref:Membrane protein n=1 Tax=Nocardioides flavus (ex Wang et al. 2016) TaxID=2058780 RepID=A0ABQ3HNZ8_9ACTN|nr:DUF2306 domain-containing protein [Nocardioides flavus (ex Wang et al. 2016)]GHE19403.1 membrane protein [Nocardioides flavus (ex Wang et al. 2016)]
MTTTSPERLRPSTRARGDWWIPTSLLALAVVPSAGGAARLVDLSGGRTAENARFFDLPAPILVHIVGSTTFLVLGALQVWPSFRRRRPAWHRWSGRVLVPAGLAGGLSGMWMAAFSDVPAHDNATLMWLRLLFGAVMVAGLVLGLLAIRRRDVRTHQRWMARAYAVAQGAGTQALFLDPVVVLAGQPSGNLKAVVMGAAWVVNLAVAEWLVRRSRQGPGSASVTPPGSGQIEGRLPSTTRSP